MDVSLFASMVAIATGIVTLVSVGIRATQTLEKLKMLIADQEDLSQRIDSDLRHEIEKLALTINGVRERMEHINTRVSTQLKAESGRLKDVEAYLTKNTSFEGRRSGE